MLDAIAIQDLREQSEDLKRRVAELRMAGYSVVEIAERLGITKTAVDRKLAVIRRRWTADRPG